MKDDYTVKVLVLSHDEKEVLFVLEKAVEKMVGEGEGEGKVFRRTSMWGLPGGRKDPGDEDEITTAVREVREEIGLEIDIIPGLRVVRPLEDHTKIYLMARPIGGLLRVGTDETHTSSWFPLEVLDGREVPKEGIISSHVQAARQLLWLWESKKRASERRGSAPRERVRIAADGEAETLFRPATEEECRSRVGTGKPIWYKNAGRTYGGSLQRKRNDGRYWFKGTRAGGSEIIGAWAASNELFIKVKDKR